MTWGGGGTGDTQILSLTMMSCSSIMASPSTVYLMQHLYKSCISSDYGEFCLRDVTLSGDQLKFQRNIYHLALLATCFMQVSLQSWSVVSPVLTFGNSASCPCSISCVPCCCHNKQRLHPYTVLTVWSLLWRQSVFPVKYELQDTKTVYSAHTVNLCILYGSHNKQWLFP